MHLDDEQNYLELRNLIPLEYESLFFQHVEVEEAPSDNDDFSPEESNYYYGDSILDHVDIVPTENDITEYHTVLDFSLIPDDSLLCPGNHSE